MKDSNNENGARVPDVPSPAESDDPNGRWSIEERDQLLCREQEARLEAEVMRDANLALTQDLSLERILETLLDYLRKLVPFDSANVMLVAGDSCFVTSAIKGYENFLEDISLAKGNSYNPKTNALLRQICETKQSLLISDTKEEPRWQSVPGSEHVRNWIGVPLFAHDEIMGLYSLDKAQPGFFTAEHVRKAESLAAQAATAIRNAQLFGRVERYAAELEQLVAERRQAEEALRESEQLSRSVFEHIDEIVYMVSAGSEDPARGIVQFVSGRVEQIIGYKPDEFMNDPELWFNLLHPDDVPAVVDSTRKIFQERRSLTRVYRVRHKHTGQYHWMEDLVVPRLDEAGTVAATFGVARDITERKQAEEARREAEEKYRDIFENAGEGIFQSTPDGRFISANPAFARMHGFDSPEDLIRSWDDISRQIYADPARREEFKRLLEENGILRGFEHQVFRKDGSKIWISVNARAVRDEGGAIRYYEGTAQDINERKRAEARSAAFATLARKLSGARTQLDAGRIITQTADDLFGWDSCDLNHYDADRDLVYQMLNIDIIDGRQTEVFGVISGRKPTARGRRTIDHGPELLLREEPIQFDADAIPYGDRSRPSASIMTVPIRHADRVIGLLSIQSYTPHSYDTAALDDLQALADHCGAALNRIRAEEELRESEERYRDLVENSEELICTHDLEGRILSANRAAAVILGYQPKEPSGKKTLRDILAPEVRDQFDDYLARLQEEGFARGLMLVQTSTGERRIWEYYNTLRTEGVATPIVRGMAHDITDRKRAENALRESEARFRQLSEAPFEAIILHDQGTILEVNQSFCRMYGYERAEVIGKSVLDLTPPEFREPLLQKVRSGGAGSYDGLALRKDGTIFRAELAGKPIHYQGRTVRVAAIRDITEQKRNERRQAAQYAITRVLAESATLAEATPQLLKVICENLRWNMGEFWRVSDSTNLLRCVETWHVPGLDATSFIEASRQTELAPGVGLLGRVWQSGQPAWIPDVTTDPTFRRAAIAAKVGLHAALAFPILLGSQTLGAMLFLSRRVRDVDEDLLETMSAIGSQIGQFTERKRAEGLLRESEERYRDLVENSRDFICTHDLNGLVLSANRAASDVLGYDLKDYCGKKNLREFLVPEVRDRFDEYLTRIRRDGVASGLMLVQTSSGDRRILEYHNTLRTEGVAAPVVRSMARDVTEQRRAEKTMSDLRRELELTMSAMEEGIHRVNMQGNIAFENPAAARMLGWEVAELLGKPAHLTMHHTRPDGTTYPKEECPIYATSRDGISRHAADEVFWRRDGTSFPVEYKTAPMRNDRNEIVAIVVTFSDITERKRAEESLQLFRNLIDQSGDAIEVIDQTTFRFIDCNESAYRSLGYSREEFLSLTIFDIDSSIDRSIIARLDEEMKEPGFETLESLHLRKDGTTFPVEINVKLVRLERDYRLAVVRDITGRKRAEEALREREAKLSAIYSAAPVGIGVDVNRVIQEVNDTMCSITGYSRDELIGQNSRLLFLTQEDYESVGREKNRMTAERLPKSILARLKRKDGRIIDVLLNAVPLDAADLSQGVTFTVLDITERKGAEEALRESEERYRELFENAKDAIYVHDLSGRYTSVNRAAEQLSGFTREEILGKHFSNFVSPRHLKHVRVNLCRKLDEENETIYDVDLVTRTGQRVPVEVSSRLVYENGVAVGVQGVARDITDRKRAQEALRIYSQRLIQAQEAEREKIARELHDQIGQILTAVRINLQSIQRSYGTDENISRFDESIGIVDEALGRVRELSIELRPSLLDDLGLTAALRWYVDRFAQRTGIIAEMLNGFEEGGGRLPGELETVCFRIAQEALTNVARHAQAGSVSVQLERSRDRMLLTIIDDGVGFDIDKLKKSALAATALGLRGMEERALAVGGYIKIDSGLERGTQIRATFPLKRK
jgi:PAS domain S-box-containing protein